MEINARLSELVSSHKEQGKLLAEIHLYVTRQAEQIEAKKERLTRVETSVERHIHDIKLELDEVKERVQAVELFCSNMVGISKFVMALFAVMGALAGIIKLLGK